MYSKILACFLGVVTIAVIIQAWEVHRHSEKYAIGGEFLAAIKTLNQIHKAEARCAKRLGGYQAMSALGPSGCGGLEQDLASESFEGYRLSLSASNKSYSVTLTPVGAKRLLSFYSDETKVIRMGTREQPATKASKPLE